MNNQNIKNRDSNQNQLLAADSTFFGGGNSSIFVGIAGPSHEESLTNTKISNNKKQEPQQTQSVFTQIYETELYLTKFPTPSDPEGARGFKNTFFSVNKNLLARTYHQQHNPQKSSKANEDDANNNSSVLPACDFEVSLERILNNDNERIPAILKLCSKFCGSNNQNVQNNNNNNNNNNQTHDGSIVSSLFSLPDVDEIVNDDTPLTEDNGSEVLKKADPSQPQLPAMTQMNNVKNNQRNNNNNGYPKDVEILGIPFGALLENTNIASTFSEMMVANNNNNSNGKEISEKNNDQVIIKWPLITLGRANKSNILTLRTGEDNGGLTVNFSRSHFALLCIPSYGWCIFDLGSVNGVFVNGYRVPALSPAGFTKLTNVSKQNKNEENNVVLAIRLRNLDTIQLGAGKRIRKEIFPSTVFGNTKNKNHGFVDYEEQIQLDIIKNNKQNQDEDDDDEAHVLPSPPLRKFPLGTATFQFSVVDKSHPSPAPRQQVGAVPAVNSTQQQHQNMNKTNKIVSGTPNSSIILTEQEANKNKNNEDDASCSRSVDDPGKQQRDNIFKVPDDKSQTLPPVQNMQLQQQQPSSYFASLHQQQQQQARIVPVAQNNESQTQINVSSLGVKRELISPGDEVDEEGDEECEEEFEEEEEEEENEHDEGNNMQNLQKGAITYNNNHNHKKPKNQHRSENNQHYQDLYRDAMNKSNNNIHYSQSSDADQNPEVIEKRRQIYESLLRKAQAAKNQQQTEDDFFGTDQVQDEDSSILSSEQEQAQLFSAPSSKANSSATLAPYLAPSNFTAIVPKVGGENDDAAEQNDDQHNNEDDEQQLAPMIFSFSAPKALQNYSNNNNNESQQQLSRKMSLLSPSQKGEANGIDALLLPIATASSQNIPIVLNQQQQSQHQNNSSSDLVSLSQKQPAPIMKRRVVLAVSDIKNNNGELDVVAAASPLKTTTKVEHNTNQEPRLQEDCEVNLKQPNQDAAINEQTKQNVSSEVKKKTVNSSANKGGRGDLRKQSVTAEKVEKLLQGFLDQDEKDRKQEELNNMSANDRIRQKIMTDKGTAAYGKPIATGGDNNKNGNNSAGFHSFGDSFRNTNEENNANTNNQKSFKPSRLMTGNGAMMSGTAGDKSGSHLYDHFDDYAGDDCLNFDDHDDHALLSLNSFKNKNSDEFAFKHKNSQEMQTTNNQSKIMSFSLHKQDEDDSLLGFQKLEEKNTGLSFSASKVAIPNFHSSNNHNHNMMGSESQVKLLQDDVSPICSQQPGPQILLHQQKEKSSTVTTSFSATISSQLQHHNKLNIPSLVATKTKSSDDDDDDDDEANDDNPEKNQEKRHEIKQKDENENQTDDDDDEEANQPIGKLININSTNHSKNNTQQPQHHQLHHQFQSQPFSTGDMLMTSSCVWRRNQHLRYPPAQNNFPTSGINNNNNNMYRFQYLKQAIGTLQQSNQQFKASINTASQQQQQDLYIIRSDPQSGVCSLVCSQQQDQIPCSSIEINFSADNNDNNNNKQISENFIPLDDFEAAMFEMEKKNKKILCEKSESEEDDDDAILQSEKRRKKKNSLLNQGSNTQNQQFVKDKFSGSQTGSVWPKPGFDNEKTEETFALSQANLLLQSGAVNTNNNNNYNVVENSKKTVTFASPQHQINSYQNQNNNNNSTSSNVGSAVRSATRTAPMVSFEAEDGENQNPDSSQQTHLKGIANTDLFHGQNHLRARDFAQLVAKQHQDQQEIDKTDSALKTHQEQNMQDNNNNNQQKRKKKSNNDKILESLRFLNILPPASSTSSNPSSAAVFPDYENNNNNDNQLINPLREYFDDIAQENAEFGRQLADARINAPEAAAELEFELQKLTGAFDESQHFLIPYRIFRHLRPHQIAGLKFLWRRCSSFVNEIDDQMLLQDVNHHNNEESSNVNNDGTYYFEQQERKQKEQEENALVGSLWRAKDMAQKQQRGSKTTKNDDNDDDESEKNRREDSDFGLMNFDLPPHQPQQNKQQIKSSSSTKPMGKSSKKSSPDSKTANKKTKSSPLPKSATTTAKPSKRPDPAGSSLLLHSMGTGKTFTTCAFIFSVWENERRVNQMSVPRSRRDRATNAQLDEICRLLCGDPKEAEEIANNATSSSSTTSTSINADSCASYDFESFFRDESVNKTIITCPKSVLIHWVQEIYGWGANCDELVADIFVITADRTPSASASTTNAGNNSKNGATSRRQYSLSNQIRNWSQSKNGHRSVLILTHEALTKIMYEETNVHQTLDPFGNSAKKNKMSATKSKKPQQKTAKKVSGSRRQRSQDDDQDEEQEDESDHDETTTNNNNIEKSEIQNQDSLLHSNDERDSIERFLADIQPPKNSASVKKTKENKNNNNDDEDSLLLLQNENNIKNKNSSPPKNSKNNKKNKKQSQDENHDEDDEDDNEDDDDDAEEKNATVIEASKPELSQLRRLLLLNCGLLIVDEAHKLALQNNGAPSKLFEALNMFDIDITHKILLTGTPFVGVKPFVLRQLQTFLTFMDPTAPSMLQYDNIRAVADRLKPRVQRCSIAAVSYLLPHLHRYTVDVPLSEVQNTLLLRLEISAKMGLLNSSNNNNNNNNNQKSTIRAVNHLKLRNLRSLVSSHTDLVARYCLSKGGTINDALRSYANQSALSTPQDARWALPSLMQPQAPSGPSLLHNNRVALAIYIINCELLQDRKTLVFSSSVQLLEILMQYLTSFGMTRGEDIELVCGSHSPTERATIAGKFNIPVNVHYSNYYCKTNANDGNQNEGDGGNCDEKNNNDDDDDDDANHHPENARQQVIPPKPLMVLLAHPQSCGVGIELTGASRVIFMDDPGANEAQLLCRVYRPSKWALVDNDTGDVFPDHLFVTKLQQNNNNNNTSSSATTTTNSFIPTNKKELDHHPLFGNLRFGNNNNNKNIQNNQQQLDDYSLQLGFKFLFNSHREEPAPEESLEEYNFEDCCNPGSSSSTAASNHKNVFGNAVSAWSSPSSFLLDNHNYQNKNLPFDLKDLKTKWSWKFDGDISSL